MLESLPPEILLKICRHVDIADMLINVRATSRKLRRFVFDFITTGDLYLRKVFTIFLSFCSFCSISDSQFAFLKNSVRDCLTKLVTILFEKMCNSENNIPDNSTINQAKHAVTFSRQQRLNSLEVYSLPGSVIRVVYFFHQKWT